MTYFQYNFVLILLLHHCAEMICSRIQSSSANYTTNRISFHFRPSWHIKMLDFLVTKPALLPSTLPTNSNQHLVEKIARTEHTSKRIFNLMFNCWDALFLITIIWQPSDLWSIVKIWETVVWMYMYGRQEELLGQLEQE